MSPKSWLPVTAKSPFSLANIPFGIISTSAEPSPRPATVLGSHVLDLRAFASGNGFRDLDLIKAKPATVNVFHSPTLNAFAALGRPVHTQVRSYLQQVLTEGSRLAHILQDDGKLQKEAIVPLEDVTMHLPMEVGDYTDFFAGINHAFTVGSLFRGPQNALQPNYKHLPVAYHGRASSVVVSGTPIKRPSGQILANPTAEPKVPIFAPCKRLDIELELGAFVSKPNALGEAIPVDEAADNIFGYVLMNDWSARDLQVWEYVPLGPFNAKNFGTTISPWVVLPDALDPFAVPALPNETDILPYLREARKNNVFDIQLQVDIVTDDGSTTTVTKTSGKNLIWSFAQMLAHHTVGGCPMRPGDLLGSGTISGEDASSRGSLLEQNLGGKQKIQLSNGQERMFLADGDTVNIYGTCGSEDFGLVGFGVCSGQILKTSHPLASA